MKENENLLKLAKEASLKAYAPYSKFKVGACLLCESGKIYTGCNVENSSYGLSLCAERNAISNAICDNEQKFKKIAIYSPNKKFCTPCGACRQWLFEFNKEGLKIILEDKNSKIVEFDIEELLPHSFKL